MISETTKRRIEEFYFDFFLSRHNLSGDYLVSTSAFIPKTLKAHAHKFKTVSYIPPTPNELEIFEICKQELARAPAGEQYNDAYTNKKRLTKFRKSIIHFTKIISYSPTVTESYAGGAVKVVEIPFVNVPKMNQSLPPVAPIRKKTVFLYVAYSVLLKGLHRLLEEWEMAALPNAELHLVGRIDESYQRAFRINLSRLQNVIYFGYVADIQPFYADSDMVVIPSLIDNEPSTAVEALSLGKPVLISNHCGYSKFIGDKVPDAVFNIYERGALASKLKDFVVARDSQKNKYDALFRFVSEEKVNSSIFYEMICREAMKI